MTASPAAAFALRCAGLGAFLIGLSRFSLFESQILAPLTGAQGALAGALFGSPAAPIAVTSACSGADAFALCVAAIAAYPTSVRSRVLGALGGVALLLVCNVIRIGTLGRVAGTSAFDFLHSYAWPAVLVMIAAGYVITWTTRADGTPRARQREAAWILPPVYRPYVLVLTFLAIYLAASPLYLHSALIGDVAGVLTSTAAWILTTSGINALSNGGALAVPSGRFVVTQECLMTPLIPVYLAAACTYCRTALGLVVAVAATVPLFIALGLVRLLFVALPAPAGMPTAFLVHAFFQLLTGAGLVCIAAFWRHRGSAAWRYAAAGLLCGALFIGLAGPSLDRAVLHLAAPAIVNPQGALLFLPVFQFGLFLAIWTAAFTSLGWRRLIVGLALLAAGHALGHVALEALARQTGVLVHVREIRALAIAGPLAALALVNTRVPARR